MAVDPLRLLRPPLLPLLLLLLLLVLVLVLAESPLPESASEEAVAVDDLEGDLHGDSKGGDFLQKRNRKAKKFKLPIELDNMA